MYANYMIGSRTSSPQTASSMQLGSSMNGKQINHDLVSMRNTFGLGCNNSLLQRIDMMEHCLYFIQRKSMNFYKVTQPI